MNDLIIKLNNPFHIYYLIVIPIPIPITTTITTTTMHDIQPHQW